MRLRPEAAPTPTPAPRPGALAPVAAPPGPRPRSVDFAETLPRLCADRAFRDSFFADPINASSVSREEVEAFAKSLQEYRRREALKFLRHLHSAMGPRDLAERFDADAGSRPHPTGVRAHAKDALAFARRMARLPGSFGEAARLDALALQLSAEPHPWPALRLARVGSGLAIGWRGFDGAVTLRRFGTRKQD